MILELKYIENDNTIRMHWKMISLLKCIENDFTINTLWKGFYY